jgi:hypothetical protein
MKIRKIQIGYFSVPSFFLESLNSNQTKPTKKCNTIIPATTYKNVFEWSLMSSFYCKNKFFYCC